MDHTSTNERYWDDHLAAVHGPLARGHWAQPTPHWGLWATPESELAVLPADVAGQDTVELGCGTAYVSAWLARAGAHPVGIDISRAQLGTAAAMQAEFDIPFPLVHGDAEQVPCADASFDLVISEYGASLWCDPYRWIPEAARLLRPGGRLAFLRPSPLFALCSPDDVPAGTTLLRPQRGMNAVPWGDHTEFFLPHGDLLRLLRSCDFTVDDLVEIHSPETAGRDFPYVTAAWGRRWPVEELWQAHLSA